MENRSFEALSRLAAHAPLLVLTGAGISTGSGIPTYRDERGVWLRSAPITHQEFVADPRQRQRYWGRSALGWPAVRDAQPSTAHIALAALEAQGVLAHVITQNVDRLHQRAGSRQVTDLHGRLDRVHCLQCGEFTERDALQTRLLDLNPWLDRPASASRPDGDSDLAEDEVDTVQVPPCQACGGILMPDVVFFGGSIPRERVQRTEEALASSAALLVIGSSLQVYSGYRLCRWAMKAGKPLFIINPGETRADHLAEQRYRLSADSATEQLLDAFGAHRAAQAAVIS